MDGKKRIGVVFLEESGVESVVAKGWMSARWSTAATRELQEIHGLQIEREMSKALLMELLRMIVPKAVDAVMRVCLKEEDRTQDAYEEMMEVAEPFMDDYLRASWRPPGDPGKVPEKDPKSGEVDTVEGLLRPKDVMLDSFEGKARPLPEKIHVLCVKGVVKGEGNDQSKKDSYGYESNPEHVPDEIEMGVVEYVKVDR